jgi:tetratricopeptide (TPR) repeat protein
MAKIALRIYNREIEDLIEGGHIDESIAHSRHILKTYPKHVDSYRLLGKAYLEGQRYGDAADIFQRVLSSIPNDFISHVGMSIIREDEGNLDAALWHMERAFEVQPSNQAIQGELRRLYGRRDGIEPPKIRLTRGALARMYAHGNLYDQAIAELRAALAEDPQRPDLLVLLAEMHYKANKGVETADICTQILNKLPNCLTANLLLSEVLKDTDRFGEIETYRRRVQVLDPYAAQTSPQTPLPENVPDQAILVERLVWRPGQVIDDAVSQPAWAASLGIEIEGESLQEDAIPDWLSSSEESPFISADMSEIPDSSVPSLEDEIAQEERVTSDWMQDLSEPSLEAVGEITDEIPAEDAFEDSAQAHVPDWLQEMETEEPVADETILSEEPLPSSIADDLEKIPDTTKEESIPWLRGIDDEPGDATIQIAAEFAEDEKPEWLQDLKEIPSEETVEHVESLTTEETPEWFQEVEEPPVESPPEPDPTVAVPAEDTPEWLQELGEPPVEPPPEPESVDAVPSEETPEWLQELGEPPVKLPSEPEPTVAVPAEDTPEWLQELGEHPVEPPPEPESVEAVPAEDTPEWLQELEELPVEPPSEPEPSEAVPTEETPEWLQELEELPVEPAPEPESIDAVPAEDIPEWLQELEELPVEPTPEPESIEAVPAEDIPEWLQEIEGHPVEPPPEPEPISIEPDGESLDWLEEIGEPLPESTTKPDTVDAISLDDTSEWLQELSSTLDSPLAESETGDIISADKVVTDWLEGLEEDIAEPTEVPITKVEHPLEGEEIPGIQEGDDALAWLESLAEKQGVSDEELLTLPEDRKSKVPDWIKQAIGDEVSPEETVDALPIKESLEELLESEDLAPEIPTKMDVETTVEPSVDIPFDELVQELVTEVDDSFDEMISEPSLDSDIPTSVEEGQDALAWLESLAEKQGVSEEELLTEPETRSAIAPDWVQQSIEESLVESPVIEPDSAEEIPVDEGPPIEDQPEDIPIAQVEEEPPVEAEMEMGIDQEDAPEWLPDLSVEEAAIPDEPLQFPTDEPPEWLPEISTVILEEPIHPEEVSPASVQATDEDSFEEPPAPDEELLFADVEDEGVSLLDTYPSTETPSKEPIIPPVEDPEWLAELADQPVEEHIPSPEPPQAMEPISEPAIESESQEELENARTALDEGELINAIGLYSDLIKRGEYLEEILADIQAALFRHPLNVNLHQTLGDAFMRGERLQDALDSYTKAEELLR